MRQKTWSLWKEGEKSFWRDRRIASVTLVLEVDVSFHVRYSGSLMRVRPYSFRYVAWVRGGNLVLKYHNVHTRDDDYHHRVYNPLTGRQVFHEELNRIQFPQLSEVLDEMEIVAGMLDDSLVPSKPSPFSYDR